MTEPIALTGQVLDQKYRIERPIGAGAAAFFVLYMLLFVPLLAIVKALLYLKLCQVGGESGEGAVEGLAAGLFPAAKWQSPKRDASQHV